MNNFENRVAVITGGCSGIGLQIGKSILRSGAIVVLMDRNTNVRELDKYNENLLLLQVDVTIENDVEVAVNEVVGKYGRIDILINSAGITGETNIKSHLVQTENLQKVFAVNFMGAWYTTKYAIPYMVEQNYGRILHIASIAGKEGNAGMLAYSASKSAVIGMTKVQGKEYAHSGITVNALAPAVIKTPLVEAMPSEQVKYMTDKIPMERCGEMDEVVAMICFIVSEECSFTTGFTFDFSGGRATY